MNGKAHAALEARLADFFHGDTALLFNSGFDANVGFFSCVPQPGDIIVYDEYIHASVHDGIRSSRTAKDARFSFTHNSMLELRRLLFRLRIERAGLRTGENSLFLSVESLYSMDGTFAPLREIADLLDEVFPLKNGYLVVDEAHATGIYGPQGRGCVALLGMENRVLARLHTFGKALAATGGACVFTVTLSIQFLIGHSAVIITTTLIRDYLLNYARSLIYTTSLSYANIIAADCSFDILTDGTAQRVSSPPRPLKHDTNLHTFKLSDHLLSLSSYFTETLRPLLESREIPPTLVSLPSHLRAPSTSGPPSPIIPVLTPHPRPLSAFLLALGMNARPITWPTVPKGKDRVRVCLHAGNTKNDIDCLINGIADWAEDTLKARKVEMWPRNLESKL